MLVPIRIAVHINAPLAEQVVGIADVRTFLCPEPLTLLITRHNNTERCLARLWTTNGHYLSVPSYHLETDIQVCNRRSCRYVYCTHHSNRHTDNRLGVSSEFTIGMYLLANLSVAAEYFLLQCTTNGAELYSRHVISIRHADTHYHVVEVEVIAGSQVLKGEIDILLRFNLIAAATIEAGVALTLFNLIFDELGLINNSTIADTIVRLCTNLTSCLLRSWLRSPDSLQHR